MPPPVVVVGDLMVDVVAAAIEPIAHGSDAAARVRWSGGGGGANVAAGLAAGGTPVTLVARVGDDLAGRGAVAELAALGVDVGQVTVDGVRPTGTCVVVVSPDGERTMLPDRGANDALAPVPAELIAAGGWLHVSGYALLHAGSRPAALDAISRARAGGMTVSVDPASASPLRACPSFLEWVRGVDVLLPNRDELAVLGGDAQAVAAHVGEVVVTLGAEGARWTDGTSALTATAPDVEVVDTTGAGDAFAVGWIAARRGGADPAGALVAACAEGAAAVTRTGARPSPD